MRCTLRLRLLVFGYIVATCSVLNGTGLLFLNIFVFSKYHETSLRTENSFVCYNEVGQYDLFWNLTAAIPILYIATALLLFVALIKRSTTLMSLWVMCWLWLTAMDLATHTGFCVYHCSPREAGILIGAFVLVSALETTVAFAVSSLWWQELCRNLARQGMKQGGVSLFMEEMAGSDWRERMGLEKKGRKAVPARPGASGLPGPRPGPGPGPGPDDNWVMKLIPLDQGNVQILQRAKK